MTKGPGDEVEKQPLRMPLTVICSMLKIGWSSQNKSRNFAKFLTPFACCTFFGKSFYSPQRGGKAKSAGGEGKRGGLGVKPAGRLLRTRPLLWLKTLFPTPGLPKLKLNLTICNVMFIN